MSVYTEVDQLTLSQYLTEYDAGALCHFEGITAGIENTNYFVTTTRGDYVLTLVESLPEGELDTVLGFVQQLHRKQVPCAFPVLRRDGAAYGILHQRPAVLMPRLAGAPISSTLLSQCETIGQVLAQCHNAVEDQAAEYSLYQWCVDTADKVQHALTPDDKDLLRKALVVCEKIGWNALPTGLIHSDLFPDNALFDGDTFSGIIDFYHSCTAPYLFDLSVTLNAWCYDEDNEHYADDKAAALLQAYEKERCLAPDEKFCLPAMQVMAALRFWLSRERDRVFPKPGAMVSVKDPAGKKRLLAYLLQNEKQGRQGKQENSIQTQCRAKA